MKIVFGFVLVMWSASVACGAYKIGDEVADFKLKNVDGSMVSLSDFATSRGVVVVFTSNDCPQALAYEDRILDLARKISLQGWKLLMINSCSTADGPDETPEGMVKRAEDKTYEVPYLRDEGQSVALAFGAAYVPAAYVLKSTGNGFELRYSGNIDDAPDPTKKIHNHFVENTIAALNAGARTDTPMTRVTGCQVKLRH